jgi:hypothetical protein
MAEGPRTDREDLANDLAERAVSWILDQLAGTHNTGWRGTADLETDIYGWLMDHAIFRPPKKG